MTNNDLLKRLRYAFDFSDAKTIELFQLDPLSRTPMSKADLLARLSNDNEPHFVACSDQELAAFLDGLIVDRRGLREPKPDAKPRPADLRLSKNDVLKKLRIAMNFREEDMISTLEQGGSTISKSELSALFRNPNHKHFRACGNQVLRNFIKGITQQMRTG